MMDICPQQQCAGCYACSNACPTKSIKMQENERGCIYPVIDQETCIDCGLCQKVCPVCHPPQLQACKESYIGYASDKTEQASSASGGIASLVARYFIRKEGVVYGSSAIDAFDVKHIRVVREEELEQLKGSKYVHSKVGSQLQDLKQDLQQGRKVLFVGTPCQVAGVRGFLRKDYPNFYAIDLVCHGVPPQKVLNSAISYYCGEKESLVKSVRFRRNDKHGHNSIYGLYCYDESGNLVYGDDHPRQHYALGFMAAMFYRPNCHTCPYACRDRVGDLTLGDYWDRDNKAPLPTQKKSGLSMVAVNTEKGKEILQAISSDMVKVAHPYESFASHNGQLRHPMRRHASSDLFWDKFLNGGFPAAEEILKKHEKLVRRNIFMKRISHMVYAIPFVEKLYDKFYRKRSPKN